MAQATPLEGTDKVICPGGDILVHVHAHGVRCTGHNAEPGPLSITSDAARGSPAPLLFLAVDTTGLKRTRGLTVWYARGPREPVCSEKLCKPAALGFHAAWGHQVPHVFLPGWPGCRHRLLVGVCEYNVVHQPNFGSCTLYGQCARTLVLLPERVIALHIGFKAIEGAHQDRVHALLGSNLGIAHVPQGRIGLLLGTQAHGERIKRIELTLIGEFLMAQPLPQDVERLLILDVIAFDFRITAPKIGFQDTTASYPEFQTSVTEMVQHAD